jgi:hypothetical protein
MDNPDLTSTMQEMMAEMAAMRAELSELKTRANLIVPTQPVQPTQEASPLAATTRRRALRKMGGSLVAAGLGASLPIFTTSAGSNQQAPLANDPNVAAGPGPNGVNTNTILNVVSPVSLTQTFVGYDFKPIVSDSAYGARSGVGSNGGIYWIAGSRQYYCKLELPQGVKVTDITFYFTNNDINSNLAFNLFRLDPINHTMDSSVSLVPPAANASAFPQTISATGTPNSPVVTIDNTFYSYQFTVYFAGANNGTQSFWGVKVTYVNITGHFQAA